MLVDATPVRWQQRLIAKEMQPVLGNGGIEKSEQGNKSAQNRNSNKSAEMEIKSVIRNAITAINQRFGINAQQTLGTGLDRQC